MRPEFYTTPAVRLWLVGKRNVHQRLEVSVVLVLSYVCVCVCVCVRARALVCLWAGSVCYVGLYGV